MVTTANVSDRDGAIGMFSQSDIHMPAEIEKVLCDGGYTGESFAAEIKRTTGAKVEVAKRSELHTFAVIPKRWIVERTFGWLGHSRRLAKDYEIRTYHAEAMVMISHLHTLVKRL